MIKVLINGTPIYRLEFRRRKYKTLKRKDVTANDIIRKIEGLFFENNLAPLTDKTRWRSAIHDVYERKPLYETTATIHIIDAKYDEPPVASATTRQSKLDDNRRSVGREVALGRLLNLVRGVDTPVFSEIERKAIREAYENRFKQGTKPTPPGGTTGTPPLAQVRKPLARVVGTIAPSPSLQLKVA